MMQELGLPHTSRAVADYYDELIDGFVYDVQDAGSCEGLEIATRCLDTMMYTAEDRTRLAQEIIEFAEELLAD